MLDHIGFKISDLERSKAFCTAAFGPARWRGDEVTLGMIPKSALPGSDWKGE